MGSNEDCPSVLPNSVIFDAVLDGLLPRSGSEVDLTGGAAGAKTGILEREGVWRSNSFEGAASLWDTAAKRFVSAFTGEGGLYALRLAVPPSATSLETLIEERMS